MGKPGGGNASTRSIGPALSDQTPKNDGHWSIGRESRADVMREKDSAFHLFRFYFNPSFVIYPFSTSFHISLS